MKTKLTVSLYSLLLGFGVAQAQEVTVIGDSTSQVSTPGPAPQAVQPATPAPDQQPPAPPQQPPAPPVQAQGQTQPQMQQPTGGAQAAGGGQWVYTSEYGWIWMPYGIETDQRRRGRLRWAAGSNSCPEVFQVPTTPPGMCDPGSRGRRHLVGR